MKTASLSIAAGRAKPISITTLEEAREATKKTSKTAALVAVTDFADIDHLNIDTHGSCVDISNPKNDQESQAWPVTHKMYADLIALIRETHMQRQQLHRAEKSLTLQIKAMERRLSGQAKQIASTTRKLPDRDLIEGEASTLLPPMGAMPTPQPSCNEGQAFHDDQLHLAGVAYLATMPLHDARALLNKSRLKIERQLTKLAKQLPVWPWVESIHGFGALGLAQIVGEAGDLSNYANPAKVWKRMGLAVIGGIAQQRVSGAAALDHGYVAHRRAIMFCIGDSLLKKQNEYRELYLLRKEYEVAKANEAGLLIRGKKIGDPPRSDPNGVRTILCIHRRAQRYAEKRLLRDLWRVWRDAVNA